MDDEERFEKNHDAFIEVSTAKRFTPEDEEFYFDEMLKDLLTAPWPTLQMQNN